MTYKHTYRQTYRHTYIHAYTHAYIDNVSGVTTAHTRSLLEESIQSQLSQNASRIDPLESLVRVVPGGQRRNVFIHPPRNT